MKSKVAALVAAGLTGLLLVSPAQASVAPASAPSANIASLAVSVGMSKQTPTPIVALGDSYGSGVGAGNYKPGTETTCLQSFHSPAEEVVAALTGAGYPVQFTNVTCAGAKIPDLYQPYPPGGAVQLDALKRDTRLVFLHILGNDIGFGRVVEDCTNPTGPSCTNGAIKTARSKLLGAGIELLKLYKEIKKRSPKAKVIQFGYGQPMANGPNATDVPVEYLDPICGDEYFDRSERQAGAELSAELDKTLRLATAAAWYIHGLEVAYVSPYDRSRVGGLDPRFAGQSPCEVPVPLQRYHGFSALAPPPTGDPAGRFAVLHMNKSGYTVLAEMVLTEVPSGAALN